MKKAPKPGDWVTVTGLVTDNARHPEDAVVRLESHNEDYHVHVRIDRLEKADRPAWAPGCTDMLEVKAGVLILCEGHHDHGGNHWRGGDHFWSDAESNGYFEKAT